MAALSKRHGKQAPRSPRLRAIPAALVCFLAALALYLPTLCPTLPAGDSGELIAAAATRGVAHPSGYPLYTLMGNAVIHTVPFGNPAFRMNLLSAVLSAAAVAVLCLSVCRWTRSESAAVIAALSLAVTPVFWRYSLVAEVFALNNLFAALILYFSIRCARQTAAGDTKRAPFLWLAFISGLAAANHHTIVFLYPGVLVIALLALRAKVLRIGDFALGVFLFILGFAPYLYIPVAAASHPPVNWGNPTTASALLRHFLRTDYGTFQLGGEGMRASVSFFTHSLLYLKHAFSAFIGAGFFLSLLGLVFGFTKRFRPRPVAVAATLSLVLYILVFFPLTRFPVGNPLFLGVIERFYMLPNLFLSLFSGVALSVIFGYVGKRFRRGGELTAFAVVFVLFCAVPAATRWNTADQSDNYVAYDYGKNVLASVPRGGLLFTSGDMPTNNVTYLQWVEGHRTDVIALDQELLTYPWFVAEARKRFPDLVFRADRYDNRRMTNLHLIDDNRNRFAIRFFGFKEGDTSYLAKYRRLPAGLTFQLRPKTAPVDVDRIVSENQKIIEGFTIRKPSRYPSPKQMEREMLERYAFPPFEVGRLLLDAGRAEASLRWWEASLKWKADYPATYKNFALALNRAGRYRESIRRFQTYLQLSPAASDRKKILQAVDRMERYLKNR
jgi:tetratricopeptide (TPR) repeat protein